VGKLPFLAFKSAGMKLKNLKSSFLTHGLF